MGVGGEGLRGRERGQGPEGAAPSLSDVAVLVEGVARRAACTVIPVIR